MGLRGGRGGHRPRTAAGDVVADRVAGLRGSRGCRCRQSHRIVAEDVASVDVAAQSTAAVPAWTWRRHGMSPWTWLRGQPRGMSRRPRPWEGGAVCEDMDGHDGRHLRGHSRGTAVGMSLLTRAWGGRERKPATTDESTGRPRNTSPLWTWPRRWPQGMSLRTRPSKGGGGRGCRGRGHGATVELVASVAVATRDGRGGYHFKGTRLPDGSRGVLASGCREASSA